MCTLQTGSANCWFGGLSVQGCKSVSLCAPVPFFSWMLSSLWKAPELPAFCWKTCRKKVFQNVAHLFMVPVCRNVNKHGIKQQGKSDFLSWCEKLMRDFKVYLNRPISSVIGRCTCLSARWVCPCLWTASMWVRGPPARWATYQPTALRCWANLWRPEDPTADRHRYFLLYSTLHLFCPYITLSERCSLSPFCAQCDVSYVLVCLQFALQSFEIVCNTTWPSEDTCCDLPGVVSLTVHIYHRTALLVCKSWDCVWPPVNWVLPFNV